MSQLIANPRDKHGFGQLKARQYLRSCQKWNAFKNLSPATLFNTEAVCQRVDPDWRLAHLSRMRGVVGHEFFFSDEVSKSILL
jgi:hypothetical protein